MPLPDAAMERILANAFNLQRVHRAIARDSTGLIRKLFDDIAAEIARIDPTGVGPMTYRRARVDKLLKRVEELTGETFDGWYRQVRSDLARLGRQQGLETVQTLRVSLADAASIVKAAAPTQNMVKSILDTNPFRGETLQGWAEVQEQATVRRVRQQVQIGMMEEEGIDEMVRRVRGKSDGRGGFTDGVLETTTREAESIVRTAVNEVANTAAQMTYRENRRVTQSYTYTATLDSRTTLICASLDGQVFDYDDPDAKTPPQHWGCRSFTVPNIDWEGLGLDPPEEGERAARDPETGKSVQVDAGTNYEQWLRGQPVAVQDRILGPGRGKLFRDGASLSDMVRSDGSILTLDELEARV